jgi:hypothetical protein
MKRLFVIIVAILAAVLISSAAVGPSGGEYRNLKVLPRNISSKLLSRLMVDEFSDGLGVGCGFCHARGKDSTIDYASDAKPEKEIARRMMRMTLGVNKRFFGMRHPGFVDGTLVVTCNTCHRGTARPEGE